MKKLTSLTIAIIASCAYMAPFIIAKADSGPAVVPTPATGPAVLHLRVTAYSSTPDQTDSTPFITADGTYVHDGIVATNLLPFGTKVQIPSLFGDKIFTVEDRMNQKIKNGMDVWMATRAKALYFGASYANVVIVKNQMISKK